MSLCISPIKNLPTLKDMFHFTWHYAENVPNLSTNLH